MSLKKPNNADTTLTEPNNLFASSVALPRGLEPLYSP
jgi:hypothetical protein